MAGTEDASGVKEDSIWPELIDGLNEFLQLLCVFDTLEINNQTNRSPPHERCEDIAGIFKRHCASR